MTRRGFIKRIGGVAALLAVTTSYKTISVDSLFKERFERHVKNPSIADMRTYGKCIELGNYIVRKSGRSDILFLDTVMWRTDFSSYGKTGKSITEATYIKGDYDHPVICIPKCSLPPSKWLSKPLTPPHR